MKQMSDRKSPIERFQMKYVCNLQTKCWEWVGCKLNKFGHGGFYSEGRTLMAHRFSYTHFVGEIPEGMVIMHMCDNPACVNPEHLRAGTSEENVHDMLRKGRHPVVKWKHGIG